jgi:hypothetical protein
MKQKAWRGSSKTSRAAAAPGRVHLQQLRRVADFDLGGLL